MKTVEKVKGRGRPFLKHAHTTVWCGTFIRIEDYGLKESNEKIKRSIAIGWLDFVMLFYQAFYVLIVFDAEILLISQSLVC